MQLDNSRGFKKKTISKTIRSKMAEWIKTLPEDIREDVKRSYIVTGGAIASMLLGELPNDYDVYFSSIETALKVSNYYLDLLKKKDNTTEHEKISRIEVVGLEHSVKIYIKSAGLLSDDINANQYEYFETMSVNEVGSYFAKWALSKPKKDNTFLPAYLTSNAITLHDGIQIILRFVGNPEDIHKNFDYVHCTNWFTEEGGLILKQEALEAIITKELRYIGSLYPICSLFRIRKFIKRGWSITAGEVFKIAYDVSKLNLDDYQTLQDQLVGVDAAYFHEILSIISKHEGDLDRTYLFEIMNRVFESEDFEEVENKIEYTADEELCL